MKWKNEDCQVEALELLEELRFYPHSDSMHFRMTELVDRMRDTGKIEPMSERRKR